MVDGGFCRGGLLNQGLPDGLLKIEGKLRGTDYTEVVHVKPIKLEQKRDMIRIMHQRAR